jgi:dTDP-4-dehydrorhamnose reductase
MTNLTRILVLGASGMLGNAMLRIFSASAGYDAIGSVRSEGARNLIPEALRASVVLCRDVENPDNLIKLFATVRPDVVINCVGVVKQLAEADDPLQAIPVNSILPHRLAQLAAAGDARLVQVSTDCVFSGRKGMYREDDWADAEDIYGRSKLLGEVDYPHAVTLRTSIIGHELNGTRSLINWLLSQTGRINGFRRAVFSGLPTMELARIVRDYVLPNPKLRGVYHVSAAPINKFDLLQLVAQTYGKSIEITPDDALVIDRSLDSTRFRQATGFAPEPWKVLVGNMRDFYY